MESGSGLTKMVTPDCATPTGVCAGAFRTSLSHVTAAPRDCSETARKLPGRRVAYPSVGPIDFVEDDRLLQEMRSAEIDEFAGNDEGKIVRPDVRRCRAQRWMP